jgi:hypothetical protein
MRSGFAGLREDGEQRQTRMVPRSRGPGLNWHIIIARNLWILIRLEPVWPSMEGTIDVWRNNKSMIRSASDNDPPSGPAKNGTGTWAQESLSTCKPGNDERRGVENKSNHLTTKRAPSQNEIVRLTSQGLKDPNEHLIGGGPGTTAALNRQTRNLRNGIPKLILKKPR